MRSTAVQARCGRLTRPPLSSRIEDRESGPRQRRKTRVEEENLFVKIGDKRRVGWKRNWHKDRFKCNVYF